MRIKQIKNIRCIIVLIISIAILLCFVNLIGISFKVSKDGDFIALAIPLDPPHRWLSENHFLQIIIFETGTKKNSRVAVSTRRGFRGFYWERSSESLWLEGDYGFVCYKRMNGIWAEYALIKGQDDENLLVHGTSTVSIDMDQIPDEIKCGLK